MEQDQNQSVGQETQSTPNVSFPTVGEEKKSGGAKTFLIVGILILVAVLGFVIFKSVTKKSVETSLEEANPLENLTTPSSEQTVQSVTPAPSPAAAVDKTKVTVQVQNGTGISGEAAYLQTQLGKLGYSNVKVGNSGSESTITTVTFSDKIDSSVISEITQKLNSIYQNVTKNPSSPSSTYDVVIITGLKKGSTPKPSTSPVSSPSASPSV